MHEPSYRDCGDRGASLAPGRVEAPRTLPAPSYERTDSTLGRRGTRLDPTFALLHPAIEKK
jgi:hypothetical protein